MNRPAPPGAARSISWSEYPSPRGICSGAALSPFGVCAVTWSGHTLLGLEFSEMPPARFSTSPRAERWITEIFESSSPLDLAVRGTPFQRMVWRELVRVPLGQTISYGTLAARCGVPRSARAVGAACAANRIAWVIPCHRVVRADGRPANFRWGTPLRMALLAWERSRATPSPPDTAPLL